MRTHCTGTYSSMNDVLYDVRCESPVGPGLLRVRGDAQGWGPGGGYEWDLAGDHIPAAGVVAFARHAKKDLPVDLTATGEVEAVFSVRKPPGGTPQWSGGGSTSSLALQAAVLKQQMELGEVQFAIPSNKPEAPGSKPKRSTRQAQPPITNTGFQLVLKPFAMPLGAPSPATGSGEIDADRYSLHVSGGAELGRLLNLAQALGIGTPGIGLAGVAQVDVGTVGSWMGFASPAPSGKMQVRTATAELLGVSEPLLIDSASVLLADQLVKVTSFSAAFSQGTQLTGSASFPVHCTAPQNCVLQFDVRSGDASLARLNQLLNPSFSRQPWYHLLSIGKRNDNALLKLRASGHFSVPHFALDGVTASNVNGSLELSSGKLRIHELRADLLGGHQDGSWLADFTVSPPRFMGNGIISKLSMTQLASLMHDNWAAGAVDAEYSLTLSGLSADKLRSSASGTADFTWSGGSLRHVSLDNRGIPIVFSKFSGKVALQDGTFTMSDCRMQSNGASYSVKGTASHGRNLAVQLERSGGQSYAISGTIDKPHVEAVTNPAAEAALR